MLCGAARCRESAAGCDGAAGFDFAHFSFHGQRSAPVLSQSSADRLRGRVGPRGSAWSAAIRPAVPAPPVGLAWALGLAFPTGADAADSHTLGQWASLLATARGLCCCAMGRHV